MDRYGSEVTEGLLAQVSHNTWSRDGDLTYRHHSAATSTWALVTLSWSALGVIYGDILTSPLYVMTGIFESKHGIKPTHDEVIGVTSLVIWTIAALVVVKYSLIVLHADDNGNGGTFALFSLLRRAINLQFDVSGPDLPSDYRLTHYATVPEGGQAQDKADDLPPPHKAYEPPLATGSQAQGNGGAGGCAGKSTVNGRRSTGGPGGDVEAGRPGGQRDWRRELGKSFFLRKIISVMVVTVLSAVEGIKGVVHGIHNTEVVGITVAILIGLFTIQRYGTSTVSVVFAPVICVWLLLNAGVGVHNIVKHHTPIIRALNPGAFVTLARAAPVDTWHKLSGVLLCVTGTEALFADLAHFSRPAIQLSCIGLVFPALTLTYLGQGAYLAANPHHAGSLYWHSVPAPLYWPMLLLATLATITASQALISAVFSVVSQAMSQGFFPKFRVVHTSRKVHGQIYIPVVNAVMMVLTVAVVLVFKESKRLGAAYGIAVCCDMLLTTIFATLVMALAWRMALGPAAFLLVFGTVEGLFMSASLSKIPNGGWLTLLMAAIWGFCMWTWNWGTVKKIKYNEARIQRLKDVVRQEVRLGSEDELAERLTLVATGEQIHRYQGVGYFYCETVQGLPPSLCSLFCKVPALPRVVVFITNRRVPIPDVLPTERFLIAPLALSGFYHVVARYGYMEEIRQGGEFRNQVLAHLTYLLMCSRDAHTSAMRAARPPHTHPTRSDSQTSLQLLSTSAPSTSFNNLQAVDDSLATGAVGGGKSTPRSPWKQSSMSRVASVASIDSAGRAIVSKTSTPNLEEAAQHGLWRSLSDSVLVSEAPFSGAEGPDLPFMPPPGAERGVGMRRFQEEQAIRISALEQELTTIRRNARVRSTCFFGKTVVRARQGSPLWRWLMLEWAYQLLVNNLSLSSYEAFGLPFDQVVEVAQVYKL